jgi:hypothetical protein
MAISVSDRLSNPGKWFVFLLHCSLDSRRYFKTLSKAPEENLNHSFAKIIEQNIWPPEAIFVSDWLCFKISYASDSDPTSCSPPKFDVWPYVLENICNTKILSNELLIYRLQFCTEIYKGNYNNPSYIFINMSWTYTCFILT